MPRWPNMAERTCYGRSSSSKLAQIRSSVCINWWRRPTTYNYARFWNRALSSDLEIEKQKAPKVLPTPFSFHQPVKRRTPSRWVIVSCKLFSVMIIAVNIALGRPTTQLDTYNGYGPERAVDGDTNPDQDAGHCSSTGDPRAVEYPWCGHYGSVWWMVDFGSIHVITDVTIYNTKGGLLAGFTFPSSRVV